MTGINNPLYMPTINFGPQRLPKSISAINAEHNQIVSFYETMLNQKEERAKLLLELKQIMEKEMEVYMVAVVLSPTKKEEENGGVAKLIVPPVGVVAKDKAGAVAKALKLVPKEYEDLDSRLVVRVLPFQGA